MGLTSEHVHWILGGAVVAITLVLLLQELEVVTARWSRYLLGLATIAIGIELIVLCRRCASKPDRGREGACARDGRSRVQVAF